MRMEGLKILTYFSRTTMLGILRSSLSRQVTRGLRTSSPSSWASAASAAAVGNKGVDIQQEIKDLIKSNKVVVFIKGDREEPLCGFSKVVVKILQMHGVDNFKDVNVLANLPFREGVKEFTKWPTIPQVFIDGEFVGGCDILRNMHQSGELIDVLKKAGILSKIIDPEVSTNQTDTQKP